MTRVLPFPGPLGHPTHTPPSQRAEGLHAPHQPRILLEFSELTEAERRTIPGILAPYSLARRWSTECAVDAIFAAVDAIGMDEQTVLGLASHSDDSVLAHLLGWLASIDLSEEIEARVLGGIAERAMAWAEWHGVLWTPLLSAVFDAYRQSSCIESMPTALDNRRVALLSWYINYATAEDLTSALRLNDPGLWEDVTGWARAFDPASIVVYVRGGHAAKIADNPYLSARSLEALRVAAHARIARAATHCLETDGLFTVSQALAVLEMLSQRGLPVLTDAELRPFLGGIAGAVPELTGIEVDIAERLAESALQAGVATARVGDLGPLFHSAAARVRVMGFALLRCL